MPQYLPRRSLGPYQVTSVGYGCMNISHAYGVPPPAEEGARLLLEAFHLGVNFFDTAALYGFGSNEELVGKTLKNHRHEIILASKGGMAGVDGKRVINGRPEALRKNIEDSLRRLQTDVIDLYYLHRLDMTVPIEDSVGEMARFVQEGKVKEIGLSEISSATLKRAQVIHPIAALQTEYSLWTRNPEISLLKTCKELGVTFVAFSPVARGFLGGKLLDVSTLPANDIRRTMPRFYPENYLKNLELLKQYELLAKEQDCTMAQLSLAWLLNKDPDLVVIPGTTKSDHLKENVDAGGIRLSSDIMRRLDILINQDTVVGARYNEPTQKEIDTEEF
jgi:aryl-alcohol dehydrogenase-like predicted oxidoreductase